MITKKYYKLIRVSHADEGYFYIKNVSNEVGEFKINNYTSGTMEYSLDGVTWTSYDLTNKPGVNVNPNSNIYLRGTNFMNSNDSSSVINFTKDYTVGGNFMSLNNYSTMGSVTTIDSNNFIQAAFSSQSNLVSAGDLNFGNVTTIGLKGLFRLFFHCSSLITPPDFSNVTSVGDSGLRACFDSCNSLITPPDFSNVTSVGDSGLNGFLGGCISLTTGLDLSNVTSVGPNCLSLAFYGCSQISNVTTPNVQDLTQNSVLNNWLGGNAGSQATGTKTVRVPTGATIATNSNSGIPTGWTRADY